MPVSGLFQKKPPRALIKTDHPLVNGLVFDSWMGEGQGSTTDLVGKDIGTITTAAWKNDDYGPDLDFSVAGSKIAFPTIASQDSLATLSLEMLVNLRTFPGGADANSYQFFRKVSGSPLRFYLAYISGGTNDKCYEFGSGWTTMGVYATPLNSCVLNAWTHVVVTYSFSASTNVPVIYINGASQTVTTTTPASGSAVADSGTLVLGNRGAGDRMIDGKMAYGRMWNRILTQAEVSQLNANPWAFYLPVRRRGY